MKYFRNNQAFTLIEVIVALLITSLVLISFFTLLIQANKTTHKSNEIMDVTYAAQIKMESFYNNALNARSFEDIAAGFIIKNKSNVKLHTNLPISQSYQYSPVSDEHYTYSLTLGTFGLNTSYKNAVYVYLEVTENGTKSKAVLENVYILGGAK